MSRNNLQNMSLFAVLVLLIGDLLPVVVRAFHAQVRPLRPPNTFIKETEHDESASPLFTDALFEEVADLVQDRIDIPMLPPPIVGYCLREALNRLTNDLSPNLKGRIEDCLISERTATTNDDISDQEVNDLAGATALEVLEIGDIHVPMLDSEQTYEVLREIFRLAFCILTTTPEEQRLALAATTQELATDLLSNAQTRQNLVIRINEAVDFPILNEKQEETALTGAVDACAATLVSLLPQELIRSLRGESSNTVAELKEFCIVRVNKNVNLIGLSEEQEADLIRAVVHILIDLYISPGDPANQLIMTSKEQVIQVQEQMLVVSRELELARARFRREEERLRQQLCDLETRLDIIDTQSSGIVPGLSNEESQGTTPV